MPPHHRHRRSVLDLSGAQTGDVTTRDSAGRDINHGADPGEVLSFLRAYVFEADQRRETGIKAVGQELGRARQDMVIISDAVRSVRDRLDDDDHDRVRRQRELDRALAELGGQLEAQAIDLAELRRGQRIARRWLAMLTLVLLGVVAVEAALVWRELAALASRALYDTLAPTVATWRR